MNKQFWKDPYQHTLNTHVASVDGDEIRFEDTIVYSFSGGQESDLAYVNDMEILSSRMQDNLICYTLPKGHGLSEGDQVVMRIDWDRRLKLMRLHFAAELILEIVTQKYGFEKIGAHISADKARIDFKSDNNIASTFDQLLHEYNQIIAEDRLIQTGYLDESTQRRYWKIDGFAQVPCGGTHVKSTAEVGYVTLKRLNRGKGQERIEIRLV